VKFARFRPDADEATEALVWVRQMVERTTVRPGAAGPTSTKQAEVRPGEAEAESVERSETTGADEEARP
jgi:hypothetical protein